MAITPDRRLGPQIEEDETRYADRGAPPSVVGAIARNGDALFGRDADGVFNLRTSATGVTEETHKALLHLAHFIDDGPSEGFASGATKTTTWSGIFCTQELWRRADTTKLVERNMTWTGINLTTDEWKIYAADGSTVLATVSDSISYSGVFESTRTRTVTP